MRISPCFFRCESSQGLPSGPTQIVTRDHWRCPTRWNWCHLLRLRDRWRGDLFSSLSRRGVPYLIWSYSQLDCSPRWLPLCQRSTYLSFCGAQRFPPEEKLSAIPWFRLPFLIFQGEPWEYSFLNHCCSLLRSLVLLLFLIVFLYSLPRSVVCDVHSNQSKTWFPSDKLLKSGWDLRPSVFPSGHSEPSSLSLSF